MVSRPRDGDRLAVRRGREGRLSGMICHVMRTLIVVTVALAAWRPPAFAQSVETGRNIYETRCVGCHGSDGAGTGHGPPIVDIRRTRAVSTTAMRDLIRNGIPNTAMPPFAMPDAELDALVAFVEVLRVPAADHPAAGDASAGERFFAGKGNCLSCHMVRGRGRHSRSRPLESRAGAKDHPDRASAARTSRLERPCPCACAMAARSRLARYESPFDMGVQGSTARFIRYRESQVESTHARAVAHAARRRRRPTRCVTSCAYLTRLTVDRSPPRNADRDGHGRRGQSRFAEIARPKAWRVADVSRTR